MTYDYAMVTYDWIRGHRWTEAPKHKYHLGKPKESLPQPIFSSVTQRLVVYLSPGHWISWTGVENMGVGSMQNFSLLLQVPDYASWDSYEFSYRRSLS